MTQPAIHKPYTYMCAVCMNFNHRRRQADWLMASGFHVCEQHREHAETHGADCLRRKP